MSKSVILAAVASLFFGFGCSPKPASRAPSTAAEPAAEQRLEPTQGEPGDPQTSEVPASSTATVLAGLYREVDGRQLFVPCGEPAAVYELAASNPGLATRYAEATMQGYAGQSVVVEFRGELRTDPEPRAGRVGQVAVAELVRITAKNPRNTCIAYDFWGLGNEPFWSLQISAAEGLAEFSLLGANTVRFAYAPPSVEEDGRITRYFFPGEQRLKATFTEATCTDSMAGNPYAYSVVVEVGGKVYNGCAMRPPVAE